MTEILLQVENHAGFEIGGADHKTSSTLFFGRPERETSMR